MKQSPRPLDYLEGKLSALEDEGLLRTRPVVLPEPALSFCSNDYLGLAREPAPPAAAGAAASRLIVGERPEHGALERALSNWLEREAALLYSSGYAANLGVITALAEPGDLILSDALNHASIVDGCRLSRASVEVVPHLSIDAFARALARPRAGRAWVVTESYFSMDGDSPDLMELRRVCDAAGAALIVDEAHALGVFGPRGRGVCAESGIVPDVLVGTLGKAFGAAGAFVSGSETLVHWLWNRSRPFVFSTGLPPVTAAAALRALSVLADDAGPRARLHANVRRLRDGLQRAGLPVRGYGPIIPIIVGDARATVRAADALGEEGVHVHAVRPPTVPPGTARLRVTTTALHTSEDIERALGVFGRALEWFRS